MENVGVLEVMLLGLSIPNPCQAGGGNPEGRHLASRGLSTALFIPCGLDVEVRLCWGEVRIRLLQLILLWFHFTVPAQLPPGLSGAPRLWDQPRTAAVGFLQGKDMLGRSEKPQGLCLHHWLAGAKQPPAHGQLLLHGEICCPAWGTWVWAARAPLSVPGPAAKLQGFALQSALLAPFPPGPALSKAFGAMEPGKELF